MNRLDFTVTGGLDYRPGRDFGFWQDATRNAFSRLAGAEIEFLNAQAPLTPENCIILYGCVASGSSCAEGAILYKSPVTGQVEVGFVPAHTIPTSRPLVFVPLESDGAGSPVTMVDASTKRLHVARRFELQVLTTQLDYALGVDAAGGPGQAMTIEQVRQDMANPINFPVLCGDSAVLSSFNTTSALGSGRWRRWALCYGFTHGSVTTQNMRGRVPIGYNHANAEYDAIGDTVGVESVTLTAAQSGRPTTSLSPTSGRKTIFGSGGNIRIDAAGAGLQIEDIEVTLNAIPGVNAASSHENRQPSLTLAYITRIK
jgi:hypothetical protein